MNETMIVNGTADKPQHRLLISDKKPIVTYAGDHDLFVSLQQTLSSSLPSEPAEWRRSYGRAVKSVNVSASFVVFSKDVLPKESQFHLFDQPMFHTYWTQCPDVDMYKATVKEDIEMWMRVLTQYSMADWMIVVVETYDFRKSSKLIPRTTVFDKIKSDFGTKHADRCLSVINPLRSESRAAGSWRGLVVNFRLLLLTAYDRTLLKFEETIRDQRDKRNKPGWSFTKYFLLQEELAFVLEMLGVYEEALVQYDELDAMFTQFVLNSNLGESPAWLAQFQGSLDSWDGLSITNGVNLKERNRIGNNTASLIHFRNYLFSRQCAMLLCANKPAEVAQRTLPNLHNCIKELSLLEVSCPPGAVACWVLLSCIEILETCEKYKERAQVEQCSKFTAGIWAYARQKLAELGELCGLCPGQKQTSEQLHISVQIFSGMKEDFSAPVEKLKKALSSQQEFSKFYLELSELAMGTYKHIKRMRYAKSLGFDLVKFYWAVEDYSTATSFLLNALHCYEQDGWKQLAAKTKLHLAYSYQKLGDMLRYAKTCLSIAATPELDLSVRLEHLEKMTLALDAYNPDPAWVGVLNDCISITDVSVHVAQGSSEVTACIEFVSNLPVDVVCPLISMAVIPYKADKISSKIKNVDPERKAKDKLSSGNPLHQRIPVSMRFEYKQNKNLAVAAVDCDEKYFRSTVRRTDSQGKYRKVSTVSKLDFTQSLKARNVTVKSGVNTLQLSSEDNAPGYYRLGQISVMLRDNFELLSTPPQQKITYEVVHTLPTISLSATSELLAGLPQTAILQIVTLGYQVSEGSTLELTSGTGLQLRQSQDDDEVTENGLRVRIPEIPPYSTFNKPIVIFAALPPHKETNSLLHDVIIRTPWSKEPELISLQLQPALCALLRLHSARMNKFLVVTLATLNGRVSLSLHDPSLEVRGQEGVTVTPSNPPDALLELSNDRKVNFMWKLAAPLYNSESFPIETEFTVRYEPLEDDFHGDCDPLLYKCIFNISSFMTLYIVECKVEPVRGSEFCRVSTVCQLTIKVTKIHVNSHESSLMYEVFAEHNMWAVCGKAAGVLLWEEKVDEQTVTVDVMPLINGFLPLPTVKLSKYIPANPKAPPNNNVRSENHPRLEQFSAGQIYNASKGSQVHVIAAASPQDL